LIHTHTHKITDTFKAAFARRKCTKKERKNGIIIVG